MIPWHLSYRALVFCSRWARWGNNPSSGSFTSKHLATDTAPRLTSDLWLPWREEEIRTRFILCHIKLNIFQTALYKDCLSDLTCYWLELTHVCRVKIHGVSSSLHLGLFVCVSSGWSFQMGSAYQFHSWRVFVLVCAFPSVAAIAALNAMPESPRFYLEVSRCVY